MSAKVLSSRTVWVVNSKLAMDLDKPKGWMFSSEHPTREAALADIATRRSFAKRPTSVGGLGVDDRSEGDKYKPVFRLQKRTITVHAEEIIQ